MMFRFIHKLGTSLFVGWLIGEFLWLHYHFIIMSIEFDLLTSFSWRKVVFVSFKVFDDFSCFIYSWFSPESLLSWHVLKVAQRFFVFFNSWAFDWKLFRFFLVKTWLIELIFRVNGFYFFNLHISDDLFESWNFMF